MIFFSTQNVLSKHYKKLLDLLYSSELHTIFFVFLWKYLDGPHPGVSDRALSYIILLLNWSIIQNSKNTVDNKEGHAEWAVYQASDIFENATKIVKNFSFDGLCLRSEIDESLISVLVKLHVKLSGGSLKHDSVLNNLNVDINPHATEITTLIAVILKKLVQGSQLCAESFTSILSFLKPKEEDVTDKRAEMRRRAKERREKILANMKKVQMEFAKENEAEIETVTECDQDLEFCSVCRQPGEDLTFLAYTVSLSALPRRRELNYCPTLLDPENSRSFGSFSENAFKTLESLSIKNSAKLAVATGWLPSMTVRTCGHKIHPKCVPNQRRAEHDESVTSIDIGIRF